MEQEFKGIYALVDDKISHVARTLSKDMFSVSEKELIESRISTINFRLDRLENRLNRKFYPFIAIIEFLKRIKPNIYFGQKRTYDNNYGDD